MQIGTARIIDCDTFSIAARLKNIDPSYYIIRNYIKKRFEVHSSAQRGSTLALVLPFEALDERTLRYVLKTRAERKDALIKEMEESNEKLRKSETAKILKNAEREVERVYSTL